MSLFRSVNIMSFGFAAVTHVEVVDHVVSAASQSKGGWVITPNSDILRQATNDASVAQLLHRADILVADGMPLVWASRILRTPLPERVCGSDLVWSLAGAAQDKGLRIFLLGGGEPDTAARAAAALRTRFPAVHIVGTHFPPFGFERSPVAMAAIETAIASSRPDIIYVALGFPKAERLIEQLKTRFPGVWWIGVGISLSFIAGEVRRAPPFLQRIGLEWLFRLWEEPGRLAKRYLWHDIPFVIRLLAHATRLRVHGTGR